MTQESPRFKDGGVMSMTHSDPKTQDGDTTNRPLEPQFHEYIVHYKTFPHPVWLK